MGSVFTTTKNLKSNIPFGEVNTPFYLQFVPGMCVETVTSKAHLKSNNSHTEVNSIMAISHIRGSGTKQRKNQMSHKDRYYPLFRGIFEVPAKGDPVLLCTIGGVQYYLGPLNSDNHVNFNEDHLLKSEIPMTNHPNTLEQNNRLIQGQSLNFRKKDFHRLEKNYNQQLDDTNVYGETHGDIMLEGRHGNSIRVGSRSINPYIYISNGRQASWTRESFIDGTLIAITKQGTLNQHFGGYAINVDKMKHPNRHIAGGGKEGDREIEIVPGFILASDMTVLNETPSSRLMSKLVSSVNGNQDANELIYRYGNLTNQNQLLASSDRIIINSKKDDIYLSSYKDIHIGAKRHITISTGKNLIIESDKVNLGNPNTKTMEGMVLGEELKTVLKDIVSLFKEIKIMTQLGPQSPMPMVSEQKVLSAIDNILSNKHFIETN
jgi:hypothetical protein